MMNPTNPASLRLFALFVALVVLALCGLGALLDAGLSAAGVGVCLGACA